MSAHNQANMDNQPTQNICEPYLIRKSWIFVENHAFFVSSVGDHFCSPCDNGNEKYAISKYLDPTNWNLKRGFSRVEKHPVYSILSICKDLAGNLFIQCT